MATASVKVNLNLNKISKETRKAITREMDLIGSGQNGWEEQAVDIVQRGGHNYTHRLKNDIETRTIDDRTFLALQAFLPSTNVHGVVIHEGRRPGSRMPPEAPIAEWVERKLGIARSDKEFNGIVFNIRRNIARNGFKSIPAGGLQFFQRVLDKNEKRWVKRIGKAIDKAVSK